MKNTVHPADDIYAGYRIEVRDDLPTPVYYDDAVEGTRLLRVHYSISRTPSQRLFVLRHLTGATEDDRAAALHKVGTLPRQFRRWERGGAAKRILNKAGGFWIFRVWAGTPVDDPLIQLELELMIDAGATIGPVML